MQKRQDIKDSKTRINWYPGHMTKALRMMQKELKVVDIIIYVLDSRAPYSCVNPKLNTIAENKPIIFVLNKADLVDKKQLTGWINFFTTDKSIAIALDSTSSGSSKQIIGLIRKLLATKIQNNKNKNITMPMRAMVVGVPNCGKSTLVNNLCNKAKTITGNKAGVTRGKQWVTLDSGIEVLDTPGTLWPSFDNKEVANNLAFLGSIKDEVLDLNEVAFDLIKKLVAIDKQLLIDRYKITIGENDETIDIFDKICKSRMCILKGNELDYDRCSKLIIDDFRKGRIGKIILDDVRLRKKIS